MFIQSIRIQNFRGLQDLTLELDEVTVLIGSNNTGKTSILDALQSCLSRSLLRRNSQVFADYDFHLKNSDAQPQDSEPIQITITFKERQESEWPAPITQLLTNIITTTDDGLQVIVLRVTSGYNKDDSDYITDWDFLNPNHDPLQKGRDTKSITELQRLAPVFYLEALRDAGQQFRPQSQFWGPFVRSLSMEKDEQDTIEEDLRGLNQRVLDAHEAFQSVRDTLKQTGKIMPLSGDDPVSLEAVPSKVFDLLARTQVMLSGKSGARLPLARHGEGTQSLAVICLFQAFLNSKLSAGYSEYTEPILALEEPEAHLHPSAVRAVGALLQDVRGQKLIATHSGDLVASVPLTSIRRLSRSDGTIKVCKISEGSLSPGDLRKLDHHVRLTRGGLLFARLWLLVEGETEVVLFQECSRIRGIDLFSAGVCVIDFQKSAGVETLIKLADQLGIDWIMLADKDKAGDDYVKSAKSHLAGRAEKDHIFQIPMQTEVGIETYLCANGFGDIYKDNISPQKKNNITEPENGSEAYWLQVVKAQSNNSKPAVTLRVVEEIENAHGANIPLLVLEILDVSIKRAKEAE